MIYQIKDIKNTTESGETYILVSFWRTLSDFDASEPPFLENDFIMQLRNVANNIIRNRDGLRKRLSDGVFVDFATLDPDAPQPEWARAIVTVDVPAVIRRNIEAFMKRALAKQIEGDYTSRPGRRGELRVGGIVRRRPAGSNPKGIQTDDRDPHSVRGRADVQQEIGRVRDAGSP